MPSDKEIAALVRRQRSAQGAVDRTRAEWEKENNAWVDRRVRNDMKVAKLEQAAVAIDLELQELFDRDAQQKGSD